jgi:hypothetical protein
MMGVTQEPAPPPLFTTIPPPPTPAAPLPKVIAPARAAAPPPTAHQPPIAPVAVKPTPATPPPPPKPLTEAELKALDAAAAKLKTADANSFWDTALAEAESDSVRADALSWEQAEKLGLLPSAKK